MSSTDHRVLLLSTTHEVMALDRELRDRGLWRDLIPTPKELSPECGVSLEVRGKDLARVREAWLARVEGPGLLYGRTAAGYRLEERWEREDRAPGG